MKISQSNLRALKAADVDQATTKEVKEKGATGISNIDWNSDKGLESLKDAAVELDILGANGEITDIDLSSMDAGTLKQLKSLGARFALGLKEGKKDFGALNSDFGKLVEQACNDGPVNINALVQQVLRESYQENTKDLGIHANKVKFFNECKKAVRQQLSDARDAKTENAGRKDAQSLVNAAGADDPFQPTSFSAEFTGGEVGVKTSNDGAALTTVAELDKYIKDLESKMNSIGDDAQLANVDLQNVLQKQQQNMQMMSNISKMLHDTAMAIVRLQAGLSSLWTWTATTQARPRPTTPLRTATTPTQASVRQPPRPRPMARTRTATAVSSATWIPTTTATGRSPV